MNAQEREAQRLRELAGQQARDDGGNREELDGDDDEGLPPSQCQLALRGCGK